MAKSKQSNPTTQQAARWYDIKSKAKTDNQAASADVYIYGNIGDRWDDNGVIAADFVRELAALDVETINLRINSFGGSVPEGVAIYNALARHSAKVNTYIDGLAASCASYIAMAGDTISIAENAHIMIHAPWGVAVGNSKDLRARADVLDGFAKALASGYAKASGQTLDECLALLSDGADHWYSAQEAVDAGFAHEVTDAEPVAASLASSFDLSRFARTPPAGNPSFQPAAAAATPKEHVMPKEKDDQAAGTANSANAAATNAAAAVRTKEQNTEVVAMFEPFMTRDGVAALQTQVLVDQNLTMEQIQAKLLKKVGEGSEPANPQGHHVRVETVEDETDKRRGAIVNALMVRAGTAHKDVKAAINANPYRGHKLLDLARASLQAKGVRTDGMDQMQVVAAAFTQSTSDFPVILENTMHKTLLGAYALAALTWNRFCATGTVSDFRAHNRYRTGSFGTLDSKTELGEFRNKAIPDGEKASIQAATKGNIINLSREAIINDDLGAFIGLSASLGRAAARTVEVAVYAALAENSGLGPTLNDGKSLFHADHGNITTGAAISMLALDADRVAMAQQMDISGNDYLDLRPSVLLVPIGLGGTAKSINNAMYDPDTANKLQKPNIVNGLFSDIVDSPRLSGTRRYIFADPMEAPVLEVAFLDGAQEPYLEQEVGFTTDGTRYKVRLDYGVGAVDYRGAITNAGA